jgi:hypothetical protein
VGVTLWILDAPERMWPWFPLGYAAMGSLLLMPLESEERRAALVQAAIELVILGSAMAYAGYKVLALDYQYLAWMCWAVAGGLAANVAVRLALVALEKKDPGAP